MAFRWVAKLHKWNRHLQRSEQISFNCFIFILFLLSSFFGGERGGECVEEVGVPTKHTLTCIHLRATSGIQHFRQRPCTMYVAGPSIEPSLLEYQASNLEISIVTPAWNRASSPTKKMGWWEQHNASNTKKKKSPICFNIHNNRLQKLTF